MPSTAGAAVVGAACPKRVEYGPCSGVEFDGTCEVADHRCVFIDTPALRWMGIDHDPHQVPDAAERTRAALAGADVCFVNHAGGVEPVRAFIVRSREAGAESVGFIPCVPVMVDRRSSGPPSRRLPSPPRSRCRR